PNTEGKYDGATGGGCSLRFTAQTWQQAVSNWTTVGCEHRRAVADVSADADPSTGVAVYDSVPYPYEEHGSKKTEVLKWVPIGGTSLASPIVAAMFALAGGAHGVEYPAKTLYSHIDSTLLHDVASGGSGKCDGNYASGCGGSMNPLSPLDCGAGVLICNAASGYDGPTGVGTPDGIGAFTTTGEGQSNGNPGSKSGGASGGGGGDSGGGGSGGGESGSDGATTTQPATNTSASPEGEVGSGGEATDSVTPGTSTIVPVLSAPALTKTATVALRRSTRPRASQIAFAFTLNVAARVHVTLAKLVRVHGRHRWERLPVTLTFTAAKGRDRRRLTNRGRLTPGRYRLTLAPRGGAARKVTFHVR
ncbi:MAG: hypothetical protein ACRDK7_01770, partial [Solirubrobacteraceae bacterium]